MNKPEQITAPPADRTGNDFHLEEVLLDIRAALIVVAHAHLQNRHESVRKATARELHREAIERICRTV